MLGRLLLIPLFEIFGLFGFLYLPVFLDNQEIRHLPLVLSAIIVILFAVKNGKKLAVRQIVIFSAVISISFVVLFQLFGFLFPGLSKDVDIFSFSNLVRLGAIGIVAMVGHVVLFVAIYCIRRR